MTSLLRSSVPLQSTELPVERETLAASPLPREKPARLVSLDAYRGAIMLFMASGGLALPQVAKNFPDSPVWRFLAFNTDHVPWAGCSLWDLIQPSFMFMVGVAMPYSIASRRTRGDSEKKIVAHVLYRAFFLVLLAIFLTSNGARHNRTEFVFTNVLAQIGLGYAFLYLLLGRGMRVQLMSLAGILLGYWFLFWLYLPRSDFDPQSVGLTKDWEPLTGLFAHWNKNANAASAFDVWFLNLFPRAKPFVFNEGGYQTLNFVPSLATMILGLMAGEMLRTSKSKWRKLGWLLAAAMICLGLGWLAGEYVCPIVKRIWTPSWALYSAGWAFTMLAGFFWVIDIQGWRRWAFPLVVVGMNSIAMYCMAQLMKGWIGGSLQKHLGPLALPSLSYLVAPVLGWMNVAVDPLWLNNTFGPLVQSAAVLFILWLICLWMYRRGVFLRI
jgi:heparan-alpha-glucosaminide N-acetyltransferase